MKKSPSIQETMKMKTPRFRKKVAEEQEHIREEVKAYEEGRIAGLEEAVEILESHDPFDYESCMNYFSNLHKALRSKLEEAKKE